ncbi:MAG: LuxR C-terminal-related transcriptional regulator, partial [Tepidiformaceae bacterium]
AETSALIESIAGSPAGDALTLTIHRETSGNPFFVEELVRHLLERDSSLSAVSAAIKGIPEGVRQLINRRLAGLRETANSALQTAAVLGDSFSFDSLEAASDLDAVSLIEAVEEAERSGMLREGPDGYGFAHGLIRRTIYDGLSLPRRQRNHLRIAEAMESAGLAEADSSRAVLAHHWRAAGHPERATDLLLRAGDAALSLTAWEEAAKHWESALECMEKTGDPAVRRARLLEGLGDLYFLSTFEAHPSVERYLQATELYEGAGDPVSAARARSRAGRSLTYPTSGFDYEGAVEHLRAAEKVLSAEPPSVELGELYAALAHAESHALRYGLDEMLSAMGRVRELSELVDDDFLRDLLRIQSYHLQGHHLGLQGHLAEGLAMEEFASETALALRDNPGGPTQWALRWRELLLAYSSNDVFKTEAGGGSIQFSRAHTRRGLVNLTTGCSGWQILDLNDPVPARVKHERVRDPQGRIFAPFLPYDLFLCGDLDSLRGVAEAGAETLNPMANAGGIARTLLAWGDGRWSEAQEGIKLGGAGAEEFREEGSRGALVFVNRWLFRLSRIVGDFESAESILQESLWISLSSGAVKYEFFARAEMALLLAQTGRPAEAEPHRARCREILAGGEDWRGLGGRLALAEAVAAAVGGQSEAADSDFARAIGVFRRLTLPWDEAEAFELWALARGRSYRGRNRQRFVGEKLDASRSVYSRIGAGQPWFDRLAALEQRLVTPQEPVALPDQLTPREVEVLVLIAHGRSNKEIGRELVLSVRTVERHLANVYLKTGLHSHAQAASYAFANGLASIEP